MPEGIFKPHWNYSNQDFPLLVNEVCFWSLSKPYHTARLDTIFEKIYMDLLPGSQGCQKIRMFLRIKLLDLFYLIKYKNLVKLYIFHWFDVHIPCGSLTQSAATLLLHDLKSMSLPLCGGWWFRKCNWCNENILTSWKVGSSEKPNRKKSSQTQLQKLE